MDGIVTRVARDYGFFMKNKVDATLMEFEAGEDLDKLVAGDVDFGFTSTAELPKLVNEGKPLCAVLPIAADSCYALVRRDSSYRGLPDLRGHKIGLVRWECASSSSLQVLSKKLYGISSERSFKFRFARCDELIEMLAGGKIDATVLWEPFVTRMLTGEKARFRAILGPFSKAWDRRVRGKGTMISMLTTTPKMVAENPGEASGVVTSFSEALSYAMKNATRVVNRYEKENVITDAPGKRAMARVLADGSSLVTDFTAADIMTQYRFMKLEADLGVLIDRFPDAALFYKLSRGLFRAIPFASNTS